MQTLEQSSAVVNDNGDHLHHLRWPQTFFFVHSLQYYVPLSDCSNIYTVLYRPSRLRRGGWLVSLLDGEEDTFVI